MITDQSPWSDYLVSLPSKNSIPDTVVMIQAAREVLDKTYKDGLKYAKAGVMLSGICEYAETMSDLFEMPDEKAQVESEKLIAVMDEINQQMAHQTKSTSKGNGGRLFVASTGIAKQQDWQMNRAFLSPSYTTRLSDLLKVH